MKNFVRTNRHLLIAFAIIGIFEVGFAAVSYTMDHALNIPINLSPPEQIESKVLILMPDEYTLSLTLDREGPEMEGFASSVLNFLPPNDPSGVHLPIKWSLSSTGKEPAIEGVTDQPQGAGLGKDLSIALHRGRLGAGRYLFRAKALKDLPSLQPHHPRLMLKPHPKTAATWQRAVYNLLMMGQVAIVPAMLIIGLILLARLVPILLKSKSA